MSYFFTSESVSEGHPDKVADQISDAILDAILAQDPNSKVACESFVTTGLAVVGGEIKTKAYIDVQKITRDAIRKIGYTKAEYMFDGDSCGVISTIHEQSADINQGVERAKEEDQGAGDQGMMFGYACTETDNYMPLTIEIAHLLVRELAAIRREGKKPERIDTIVVSTQHDDFDSEAAMQQKIREDIIGILVPRVKKLLPSKVRRLFKDDIKYFVNPTGKFVIGGPHGDTGLTGRKIIVDTYGGKCAHGGGAFSGKDSSKVDRSAAYAVRHIAKNLVAAGVASEAEVQVAYAIGVAQPVSIYVDTKGTTKIRDNEGKKVSDGEISRRVGKIFDMRPAAIVKRFGLRNPIFSETAAYGHIGRIPGTKEVNGKKYETFTWEKLDYVDAIKKEFAITETKEASLA